MNFALHRSEKAITLQEMMVAVAIFTVVAGGLMGAYVVLQRGYAFSTAWTSARTAQTRVLQSIAQDLRNAVAVTTSTGGSSFLSLQVPKRYGGYESSGNFSGDPTAGAGWVEPQVSGTTGKIAYGGGYVTVDYYQEGNAIGRRVSWDESGAAASGSRTVGVFPRTVNVSFQNAAGAPFNSGTDLTIRPILSVEVETQTATSGTITLGDTVFLRGVAHH